MLTPPPLRIELTKREHEKYSWFLGVVEAARALDERYKNDRVATLWNEGQSVARRIDWQSVCREVFPQLVVVMAHDEKKGEKFFDFPAYIMVPRIGICLSVEDEVEFVIEERSTSIEPSVDQAFDVLRSVSARLPTEKGNQMRKQVAIMTRLVRGEQIGRASCRERV